MKITIDTKEDSHEEIRKIIRMLSSLVGEEVISNQGDMFGSAQSGGSQSEGSDIFNMFSANSGNSTDSENKASSEDEAAAEKEQTEEVDIDIPPVEEYH
ncbi:hypothetical protein KY347_00495 [Candidatus Woesearchaeota archaeon]|nr:hypothetical protein [Candidatus Woesearchaeota archaeon]